MPTKSNFTRFLKDETFIEWMLFPTDELTTYWNEFLCKHPEETENMALAEKHFRTIKLSSYHVSRDKKAEALKKLEHSLRSRNRIKKMRLSIFAASACVAALLAVSLFYFQPNHPKPEKDSTADYIVGNKLDSQDIQFISNETATSFQENVDIEINNNGIAQVTAGNTTRQEIAAALHTLNKLIVPYGKRSKIILADGTQVWLNSGTVIEFPTQFSGPSRDIYLVSGEMYIEVSPDKKNPFYVHTSDFNVSVLGTKFNVSTYADSPQSVVLVEGSVALQAAAKKEQLLSPNEQAVYSENGTFNTKKVDVNQFINWKNGYLEFDNAPMAEVLKQIARYYNLSFNYDKNITLKDLTCTGKIILSDNLDNVMTTIALISSTEYKKENSQIYITNKPN